MSGFRSLLRAGAWVRKEPGNATAITALAITKDEARGRLEAVRSDGATRGGQHCRRCPCLVVVPKPATPWMGRIAAIRRQRTGGAGRQLPQAAPYERTQACTSSW